MSTDPRTLILISLIRFSSYLYMDSVSYLRGAIFLVASGLAAALRAQSKPLFYALIANGAAASLIGCGSFCLMLGCGLYI